MDIQRRRNLTTQRMHTTIGHVYDDLQFITGTSGLMTHMLPRVLESVTPWLREQVTEPRFWDGEYDTTHTGDFPLRAMSEEERGSALNRYAAMPDPLAGKKVIVLNTHSGETA